jgi:hypothetical protein
MEIRDPYLLDDSKRQIESEMRRRGFGFVIFLPGTMTDSLSFLFSLSCLFSLLFSDLME